VRFSQVSTAPTIGVTLLGKLYQNQPEHGVCPANEGYPIQTLFLGGFKKSFDFFGDHFIDFLR